MWLGLILPARLVHETRTCPRLVYWSVRLITGSNQYTNLFVLCGECREMINFCPASPACALPYAQPVQWGMLIGLF